MMHDTVALYGFHKLFKKFWLSQLENMQKLRNYQIKRGDLPTLRTTNVNKLNYILLRNLIVILTFKLAIKNQGIDGKRGTDTSG